MRAALVRKIGACLVAVSLIAGLGSCVHMFTKGGGAYREADKAFNQGDYAAAVESALSALGQNPQFKDAETLLQKAWGEGRARYSALVKELAPSNSASDYERLVAVYDADIRMNAAAAKAERADLKPNAASLKAPRDAAFKRLLDLHYQEGSALLAQGAREAGKAAYGHFERLQALSPDFKDSAAKLARAKELGMTRLAVIVAPEANPNALGYSIKAANVSFADDSDLLRSYVQDQLKSALPSDFLRILSLAKLPAQNRGDLASAKRTAIAGGANLLVFVQPRSSIRLSQVVVRAEHPYGWTSSKAEIALIATSSLGFEVVDLESDRSLAQGNEALDSRSSFIITIVNAMEPKSLKLADTPAPRVYSVNVLPRFATFADAMNAATKAAQGENTYEASQAPWNLLAASAQPLSKENYASFQDLVRAFDGADFRIFDLVEFSDPAKPDERRYMPLYTGANWDEKIAKKVKLTGIENSLISGFANLNSTSEYYVRTYYVNTLMPGQAELIGKKVAATLK